MAFTLHPDLTNPGHYLACRGVQAAASAEGKFENGDVFVLRKDGSEVDASETIRIVAACEIVAENSEKDSPILFRFPGEHNLKVDWWTRRDGKPFKSWAGGQSSKALVLRMQEAIRKSDDLSLAFAVPMTGRFNLDPNATRSVIDVGFSPDRAKILIRTFPVVELFAFIGLQEWTPKLVRQPDRVDRWEYAVSDRRFHFGMQRIGKSYKAPTWAEEVHDESD